MGRGVLLAVHPGNIFLERAIALKANPCAICGADAPYRVVFPEKLPRDPVNFSARRAPDKTHFQMVKCDQCRLIYSNPIWGAHEFTVAYEKADYIVEEQISNYAQDYARQLKRLMPKLDAHENLLEIGCGDGFFLKEAKAAGFKNAFGVEPGRDAVRRAPEDIRQNIVCDFFRPSLFKNEMFDVISLFQVFDHLLDPGAIIEDLLPMLKPGGWLLAINHNIRSWMTRILRESSPMFDIQHIYLFDPKTMTLLMQKYGFEEIACESIVNRYAMNYLLKMLPLPRAIKSPLVRTVDGLKLGGVTVPMAAGNMVTFARKPS